ncbi:MAG: LytTR family transcriptional regulator DNA-binding domain-containing protein [Roseburia sp.]|nr:LytTR family transcriptional regulator DNA-binding domain-containing protein [Roseburia sp.]
MNHFDIRDIIYVEHCSRTVFLYTLKGSIYIPYVTLGSIHLALGCDYLYQCHKSFLVNHIFIEKIDRTENVVILKDEMGTVAIGRKYKNGFLRQMHYI